MAEKLDLTTPYQPDPRSTPDLDIFSVTFDKRGKRVVVEVGKGNIQFTVSWEGDVALADIIALNKANLSVKSLDKRLWERMIALGKVAGTISGTPD